MWFSFWRSRDRFSLDEFRLHSCLLCRFLTDQLMKIQVVNEVNKDFVIEALRSIAELITYGDQHDAAYFEFFMEKQVMGELVRILRISRTVIVSLQLLQTMSIVIQNLKNEHSIYYMFSNEHINHLITYSFDFRNEELLSYYISFLRAISGKLNKNTISLLVKTHNEEVVSFPLYVEAVRFAFHEESMIRTAVRALTLNVYHVGDEAVNKFVASDPHADYFSNLVKFFREQCINLDKLVTASKCLAPDTSGSILSAVDEIEDNLYYFSDVISAGIPDIGRLITELMLNVLIFPSIVPSLRMEVVKDSDTVIGTTTSLYLLCCILRIVKIKDLANIVAAVLLCDIETFVPRSEAKLNGFMANHDMSHENQDSENGGFSSDSDGQSIRVLIPNISNSLNGDPEEQPYHESKYSALREALLSYITTGDDVQVSGSLSMLATLLQTKELEESMLDALGILPQRKQQKKLLLQALVGEGSAEEQLFSSENIVKDEIGSEMDCYLQKLKEQYGLLCVCKEVTVSPRIQRLQVLDALVSLFCRSNISAETLWDGGWLLRQLLPYSEADFNSHHLKLLKDSFHSCTSSILDETKGTWPDLLIMVLCDEWRKCKRTIEASSPRKDPKSMLLPSHKSLSEELTSGESSFASGERLFEIVKVFVLLHQLHIFSVGKVLPDQPLIHPTVEVMETSRAKRAGVDSLGPKPSIELRLVDAVPCRIAFERGKERHFHFLTISVGISGWLILADELPVRPSFGVVRVVAPLGGCNPRIDEKHMRWLHLRIRPSSFPYIDAAKHTAHAKVKSKALVDGRWTLAFRDEDSCKAAFSMIVEELNLLSNEVERRVKPMLDIERTVDTSTK
ncbi:protein TRANSPARENT TESTA 9 isoform X2 [Capsicum annuum]|uniref:protein TRANSPARENT TESTA 9 isoform X2 n=1 Tax=Capsicum annuum TaxID=4072 RepID=UPI001FB18A54|nr:protein TRANSPARENT TESTA 9 isoform X2 [Capsicum annuum]